MRISKLQLQNIGVFDDEEIEIKPVAPGQAEIHIFTGPNGSGKTTILLALAEAFAGALLEGSTLAVSPDSSPKRSHPPRRGMLSANQNGQLYKRFRYSNRSIQQSLITTHFGPTEKVQVFLDAQNLLALDTSAVPNVKSYKGVVSYQKVTGYIATFAALSYSGYRYLNAQKAEIQELEGNPLFDALDFIKDINDNGFHQWLVTSLSKMAWEERKNGKKATKFTAAISAAEIAISEITGWAVKFDMETDPLALVLNINGKKFDFDVLPDGLRSLISWMGDLLMRVDSLKWQDDLPAFEKNLILFLDEIEVHLHPAWQRKVLPVVQKLFKNSQIFLSTHSPFVVNSVDGAWVYELDFKENGSAYVKEVTESKSSYSVQNVLRTVFDVTQQFGGEAQKELDNFQAQRDALLQGEKVKQKDFLKLARKLAARGLELQSQVEFELLQLSTITGDAYEL